MTSLWNTFSLQSHLGITNNPARQLIHPTCSFQFGSINLLLELSKGMPVAKLPVPKFFRWNRHVSKVKFLSRLPSPN